MRVHGISYRLLLLLAGATIGLAGCASGAGGTVDDPAPATSDDTAGSDDADSADAQSDEGDDGAEEGEREASEDSDAAAAHVECDGFPSLTFSLSGAASGEGSTELPDYSTDGNWAYLGFGDPQLEANLDIAFPRDFTVGEAIDLAEAAAADPNSETGGEVAGSAFEDVTGGTLTVTGTGEQTGFPTICGTFEMTLQGADGELVVTGDFANVADVG